MGKQYSDEEKELIINDVSEGKSLEEIVGRVNQTFSTDRTEDAVKTKINQLRKEGLLRPSVSTIVTNIPGESLSQKLRNYDNSYVLPAIERREELIYRYLKLQADRIRDNDLIDTGFSIPVLKQRGMSDEEIIKIVHRINPDDTKKISDIDLIVIPGYATHKNETSLVLPVYTVDVQDPTDTLKFDLYKTTLDAFRNQHGLKDSSTREPKFNFRKLIGHHLEFGEEWVQYRTVESTINDQLSPKYDINVRIKSIHPLRTFGHINEDSSPEYQ